MQVANTPLEAEIERLYWDNATDGEMAQAVGCAKRTVCAWRGRIGYPPNDVQGRKPYKRYKISLSKTGEVLARGTMSECARMMGKPEDAVRDIATKTKRGLLRKYVVEVSEVYGRR